MDPDCVIALSYGIAGERTTSDVNRLLADIAQSYGLPIIAQSEVADNCQSVAHRISKAKGYLDTWQVLKAAELYMQEKGLSSAILVAHAAHLPRAMQQAKKAGIVCRKAESAIQVWDAYSLQWWTRNPWLWRVHELYSVPLLKLQRKM